MVETLEFDFNLSRRRLQRRRPRQRRGDRGL